MMLTQASGSDWRRAMCALHAALAPHTARLDALKACKAEIVKAPTPKAMTETPLEGDAMMILKAKMMAGK